MALATLVMMTVLARGCHETSESRAVGLAHCTSFGSWNDDGGAAFGYEMPRLSLGWTQLQIDRYATDVCVPAGKSCTTISRLPAGGLGGQKLAMGSVGIDVPVARWGPFWLGPVFEIAARPGWSLTRTSSLGQTRLSAPELFSLGGMIGAELRVRRVALHGGLRFSGATLDLDASTTQYQRIDDAWFSLQLRGGLELWLTPGLALGAAASIDLLRTDHVSANVFMVVPIRAPFAGVNSVW